MGTIQIEYEIPPPPATALVPSSLATMPSYVRGGARSPHIAAARVQLNASGEWYTAWSGDSGRSDGAANGRWLTNTESGQYEVYFTATVTYHANPAGSVDGSPLNTWLSLDTDRYVRAVENSGGTGHDGITADVTGVIRRKTNHSETYTFSVSLEANGFDENLPV